LGSKAYPAGNEFIGKLELPTTSCGLNETDIISAAIEEETIPGIANFYQISYMYVGTVGFITTFGTCSYIFQN
jgi:hypothetical protein